MAGSAECSSHLFWSRTALFRMRGWRIVRRRANTAVDRFITSGCIEQLGRFRDLRETMMLTIPETVTACGLSKPTVARALKDLIALGIASELTGAKRNRVFLYDRFFRS